MKNNIINALDDLFEDSSPDHNKIQKANEIISEITPDEQLELHGKVKLNTLKGLYKNIDKINVDYDVKEHIVWFYYASLYQRTDILIEDSMLEEILNDYRKFNFGALESLVINLIRYNQLSFEQIQRLNEVIKNKEIHKQYHIYKTRKEIDNGVLLDRSDINRLIGLKAFSALEYALENNAIKKEALNEFKSPEKGESDRKIKYALFKKAQEFINSVKIIKIEYPTPLSSIKDIENDNIDLFVELDDGYTYTLVVSTPKNLLWYMDKEGINFIPASPPNIIVRSLTEENIEKALETYIQDKAYWLKYYHLAGSKTEDFDVSVMNRALEQKREHKNNILSKGELSGGGNKPRFIGYLNNKPLYRDANTGETFTPEEKIPTNEERRSVEVEPLFYLTIIWTKDISLPNQILKVKKIWPGINMSNQEILKIAREKREWTFANYVSHSEAYAASYRAEKIGLKLEISPMKLKN